MIKRRLSNERGHADHGWLDTYHSFSFANYHDPQHVQFRTLRVLNEDRVAPGRGFGSHPHQDMEIITYVIKGALTHKDSLGSGSTIGAGHVQRISAGTGVVHSEFNASAEEEVHFFQTWILPDKRGWQPQYQDAEFAEQDKRGRLCLLVSPDGRNGSLSIRQDAMLYAALLAPNEQVEYELEEGRHAWVQLASGHIELNGVVLEAGDGAAISDESGLQFSAKEESELLLFDLY